MIPAAEPSADHEHQGIRGAVARDDELQDRRRRVQVSVDRRQGNVDDEEVQDRKERAHQQDDQPRLAQGGRLGRDRPGRCGAQCSRRGIDDAPPVSLVPRAQLSRYKGYLETCRQMRQAEQMTSITAAAAPPKAAALRHPDPGAIRRAELHYRGEVARRSTKQPLPDDFEEHILDTDIRAGAVVDRAIIDKNVTVYPNAVVGHGDPRAGRPVLRIVRGGAGSKSAVCLRTRDRGGCGPGPAGGHLGW